MGVEESEEVRRGAERERERERERVRKRELPFKCCPLLVASVTVGRQFPVWEGGEVKQLW